MLRVPPVFAPDAGEAAALSILAVARGDDLVIRAGSLITLPDEAAKSSWRSWGEEQPLTRGPRIHREEPDLETPFDEEPFPGIRISRSVVESEEWEDVVIALQDGLLQRGNRTYRLETGGSWRSSSLLGQYGLSDAHRVVWGAKRPVQAVSAPTIPISLPRSDGLWLKGGDSSKATTEHTRQELQGTELFANWPISLLGIYWAGSTDAAPAIFTIGRARRDAWIADAVPDRENSLLRVAIAWDERRIDPLSCSVAVRWELDEALLLERNWKISDLPSEDTPPTGTEARDLTWNQRTLDVVLPRAPRGSHWGASLLDPSGLVLDELVVAARVERIELRIGVAGSSDAGAPTVIGDQHSDPTPEEREMAVVAAVEMDAETAMRAAKRRLSTSGELADYLRWRFSARAGELLLMDPYLLAGDEDAAERVFDFLTGLRRKIRALTAKASAAGLDRFAGAADIEIRRLPQGSGDLHDRHWIVGDTGVMIGSSLNDFLREESAATTAADLPFADTANWRGEFEEWWKKGGRLIPPPS